jgi:glucokinase
MKIKRNNTALPSVVADIGGTNIRFARLSSRGTLGPVAKFSLAEFVDLPAALAHFLNLAGGPRPVRLGLAVAGPVFGDEVKLTNARWQFSIRHLKKYLELDQLEVVNDLEALAQVLPYLGSEDALCIGAETGNRSTKAAMAVLCPGTGMGIAGLKPVDRGWRPIAGEGGHSSLSHPLPTGNWLPGRSCENATAGCRWSGCCRAPVLLNFTAPWHPWKVKRPQL